MHKTDGVTIYILQKRKGAIKIGITTNEILIPKKFFNARVDKELEFDSLIPEHCPDIARIVKVDCTPFTESCSIEDGKGVIHGKAVYDVLYETDYKNRLRCCSFTQDFTLSIILPKSSGSDARLFCDIRCERIDCKLIGARRIAIRVLLGAMAEAESEITAKSLSVEEDGEIFFLKKTVCFDGRTSAYSDKFDFSEQLPLNRNEKCIGEIICGRVSLQPPQISVSEGRADIKTTAAVHTLCEEENNEGTYYMSSKSLPISICCENDMIDESKRINVSLETADTSFVPELDQYGESRIIRSDFTVGVKIKINEPSAYTVAEDVFEKSHDGIVRSETVKVPRLSNSISHGFTAELKTPETVPAPISILDTSARDYGSTVRITDNGLEVSGNFIVTLLVNTAEGVHSFDFPVPYVQSFPLDGVSEESIITADVFPIEVISTLHSDGSITARIIAEAKISSFSEQEETFVSEIAKRVPADNRQDGSVLVFCYPEEHESLWSIAKYYRADPETILSSNPERFDSERNALGREPIIIKC